MDLYNASIFLLVLQLSFVKIDCLSCLSCQSIDDPFTCNNTVLCPSSQVCFSHERSGIYSMGCTSRQQCGGIAGQSIIGRDLAKDQQPECQECCSTDSCNSDLCQHDKPSSCRDDETVDCAKMNSLFHICKDRHQASLVCSRFCNLCSLVDGSWAEWSAWSKCDVTCGNGSQIRHRSCNNPAPVNGGLYCTGSSSENQICKNDACPVNGEWSQWTTWGSCSVTCGVGMQRRDRMCSQPYPSRYGDHCFGDARDDRICSSIACNDGAWSDWGSWSTCSYSCDGGLQTRSRACTNPRPSLLGRNCDGDPTQMQLCNRNPCRDRMVMFTAYGLIVNGSSVGFPTIIQQYGNSYDKSSGIFTCHVPGVYHFVSTLTKTWNKHGYNVVCFIHHNGGQVVGSYEDPYGADEDLGVYSFTVSASLHLNINDTVNINCARASYLSNSNFCSFTGVLVTPDN